MNNLSKNLGANMHLTPKKLTVFLVVIMIGGPLLYFSPLTDLDVICNKKFNVSLCKMHSEHVHQELKVIENHGKYFSPLTDLDVICNKKFNVSLCKMHSEHVHQELLGDIPGPRSLFSHDPSRMISTKTAGRLGNQLFQYASLYGISRATCRIPSLSGGIELRGCFKNLSIPFISDLKPTRKISEKSFASYDGSLLGYFPCDQHIRVESYFQSYKYFEVFKDELRKEFQFTKETSKFAQNFLADIKTNRTKLKRSDPNTNAVQNVSFTRLTFVGVHVRRGDMAIVESEENGYVTAGSKYFKKAMDYFQQKYENVHFVVATDDVKWVRANIRSPHMTLTEQESTQDFAILSHCDHVIMSVGTFGWWAGWLAGGEVTYRYPQYKPGTKLSKLFTKEDFFPPHWIEFQE